MVALYLGLGYLGMLGGHGAANLGVGVFCLMLAPEFYAPLRRLAAHYHDRANALAAIAEVERLLDPPRAARHAVRRARARAGAGAEAWPGCWWRTTCACVRWARPMMWWRACGLKSLPAAGWPWSGPAAAARARCSKRWPVGWRRREGRIVQRPGLRVRLRRPAAVPVPRQHCRQPAPGRAGRERRAPARRGRSRAGDALCRAVAARPGHRDRRARLRLVRRRSPTHCPGAAVAERAGCAAAGRADGVPGPTRPRPTCSIPWACSGATAPLLSPPTARPCAPGADAVIALPMRVARAQVPA